jgi:phosphoserine phosphatase RsbU/P
MSHSGVSRSLVAGVATDVHSGPFAARAFGRKTREQEIELKLAEVQKNYADLHSALFEAAQVYRRLCAPRLVRAGDFEIASETFAARHLPGDFIVVDEGDDGAVLALCDITGKGFAAGMWTTLLMGLLDIHRGSSAEPEAIVTGVNRDLCRMSIGAPLASLFLGRLDAATGRLDYCSAGHPPALLLRADGNLRSLSDGGTLLGVIAEASFVKGSVDLGAGDVLVTYSDGILEARNAADQEFGYERLEAQVRRARTKPADAILFSVLGAVQDFVGGNPQADDISLMVIGRR